MSMRQRRKSVVAEVTFLNTWHVTHDTRGTLAEGKAEDAEAATDECLDALNRLSDEDLA